MSTTTLLDELEREARKAKRLPGTILPLIEQLRAALDEKARSDEEADLERHREAEQARQDAERRLAHAREQLERITDEQDVVILAKARAEQIEQDAVGAAEGIRKGADEYAFEVLCQLEQELNRSLSVVANGLRTLQDRRDAVAEESQSETSADETEISSDAE